MGRTGTHRSSSVCRARAPALYDVGHGYTESPTQARRSRILPPASRQGTRGGPCRVRVLPQRLPERGVQPGEAAGGRSKAGVEEGRREQEKGQGGVRPLV